MMVDRRSVRECDIGISGGGRVVDIQVIVIGWTWVGNRGCFIARPGYVEVCVGEVELCIGGRFTWLEMQIDECRSMTKVRWVLINVEVALKYVGVGVGGARH